MYMHKDNNTLEHRVLQLRNRMQQFKQRHPDLYPTAGKPSSTPITGASTTSEPTSISDRLRQHARTSTKR